MSILAKPRRTHVDATSDVEIAQALIRNHGLQYLAAQEIGMDYTWLSTRIKQSEYLQQIRECCIQLRIDKAEQQLMNMVESGNFNAVALTLRTLGRSRGYVESNITAHPADVLKAFDATMQLWAGKQKELQAEEAAYLGEDGQEALNSDNTSINNDS
jgi:hypothetical protein